MLGKLLNTKRWLMGPKIGALLAVISGLLVISSSLFGFWYGQAMAGQRITLGEIWTKLAPGLPLFDFPFAVLIYKAIEQAVTLVFLLSVRSIFGMKMPGTSSLPAFYSFIYELTSLGNRSFQVILKGYAR